MKKRIVLLSTLLLGLVSGQNFALSTDVEKGFLEGTVDTHNFTETKMIHKNIVIGDAETTLSKMFVQGTYIENTYYLRFSTAVKGDISSITYTRGAVGEQEEVSKNVSTLYKGIEAGGETYFYSTEAGTEDNLTTDTSFAEQYYWACYTISISKENYSKFSSLDLTMSLIVNEDETLHAEKTVNIGSLLDQYTPYTLPEKYGNVTPAPHVLHPFFSYGGTTNEMKFDSKVRGYYYEAEEANLIPGDETMIKIEENKAKASGKKSVGYFRKSAVIEYKINSEVETDVLLTLSLSKNNKETVKFSDIVTINYGSGDTYENTVDSEDRQYVGDNSWDSFKEYTVGELHLVAGLNTIRIVSKPGTDMAYNVDYMGLASPMHKEGDLNAKYGSPEKATLTDGGMKAAEKNASILTPGTFTSEATGYFYEAEESEFIIDGTGLAIEENKPGCSGNKQVGHFRYYHFGHWSKLIFEIDSTVETDVLLRMGITKWNATTVIDNSVFVTYGTNKNQLNDYVAPGTREFRNLGNWNNSEEFVIGEMHLKEGKNYIMFTAISQDNPVNVDYISLINPLN